MGFSRQEYWSGLPFPSPDDLPNPGIEPGSPALQADTLPSEPPGKPLEEGINTTKLLLKVALSIWIVKVPCWYISYKQHGDVASPMGEEWSVIFSAFLGSVMKPSILCFVSQRLLWAPLWITCSWTFHNVLSSVRLFFWFLGTVLLIFRNYY